MSIDKESFHFVYQKASRNLAKKEEMLRIKKRNNDMIDVFEPIRIEDLTEIEKRRAMESLFFC
jgi:hypothetical protein